MSVPEQITFVNPPVRVGQVTLRTSEHQSRMAFLPPGPDGEPVTVLTSTRSRQVRREEVVAVRGAVPERLRVTFIEDVSTAETSDESERTVAPLAGHTFEIERKSAGASIAVFEASGAPARFGVAAQVGGQYRHFGRVPAATSELPIGAQRVGQSSPELARTLVAAISRGAAVGEVDVPSATLVEILPGPGDGSLHGLYRLEVKVTGASGGSRVTMNLMGTLVLRDVDGAMLELVLQGPVSAGPQPTDAATTDPEPPAGAGEFKLTQTMVYARA